MYGFEARTWELPRKVAPPYQSVSLSEVSKASCGSTACYIAKHRFDRNASFIISKLRVRLTMLHSAHALRTAHLGDVWFCNRLVFSSVVSTSPCLLKAALLQTPLCWL